MCVDWLGRVVLAVVLLVFFVIVDKPLLRLSGGDSLLITHGCRAVNQGEGQGARGRSIPAHITPARRS